MKLILGSIFASVMLTMATLGSGCATGQFVSDEALSEMEPESRVKYYNGLETADRAADALKEAIDAAKKAYENTYDPATGEPLVPETPEDPVE